MESCTRLARRSTQVMVPLLFVLLCCLVGGARANYYPSNNYHAIAPYGGLYYPTEGGCVANPPGTITLSVNLTFPDGVCPVTGTNTPDSAAGKVEIAAWAATTLPSLTAAFGSQCATVGAPAAFCNPLVLTFTVAFTDTAQAQAARKRLFYLSRNIFNVFTPAIVSRTGLNVRGCINTTYTSACDSILSTPGHTGCGYYNYYPSYGYGQTGYGYGQTGYGSGYPSYDQPIYYGGNSYNGGNYNDYSYNGGSYNTGGYDNGGYYNDPYYARQDYYNPGSSYPGPYY